MALDRHLLCTVTLCLIVLCRVGSAAAADRYVQKTGSSNSNPCTQASPCLTIQRGVDALQEFETLYVGSGTYNETVTINKDNVTVMRAPGSPTKPVVKPTSGTGLMEVVDPRSGVTIDGFIVDGTNKNNGFCFWTADGTFDVTLRNNEARDCTNQGVLASGNGHRYENNIWLNNGSDQQLDHNIYINGSDHVITGNYLSGAAGYNMQCSQNGGCGNTIISNNTWTGSGKGFTMDSNGSNIFRNNIIFDDSIRDGAGNCTRAQGAAGARFLNNTWVNCGIFIRSDSSNVEVANSIFVGGLNIDNETGSANLHHNLFGNPGLTGPPTPTTPGYRLLSTSSTAIGQATCMTAVPDDIDGQTRPQGGSCDLGADEFTGTFTPVITTLAFTTQPSSEAVNTAISPAIVVEVRDQNGAPYTAAAVLVTLSIFSGPGGAALGGTTAVSSSTGTGRATFSTVTLNTVGTYVLRATVPGPIVANSTSFAITSAPASGNRHVQKTGSSDGNDCLVASPCLTIARGLDVLVAGETLFIHAGTYNETDLQIADANVTVRNQPGETVLIQPQGLTTGTDEVFLLLPGANGVTIEGLQIDGTNPGATRIFFGVFTDGTTNVTLRNTIIHHTEFSCVLSAGTGWVFEGNHFHHCGSTTSEDWAGLYHTGDSATIRGNTFDDNAGYQIRLDASSNSLITQNRLARSAFGLRLDGGGNNTVSNNFVWDDGTANRAQALKCFNQTTAKFYNNSLHNSGIFLASTCPGADVRNNILAGLNNLITNQSGSGTVTPNLAADPGYVSPSAGNLHLLSSATAAINTGNTLASVTVDIDGDPRTSGQYDMGADEFVGTVTPVITSLFFVTQPSSELVGTAISPAVVVEVRDQTGAPYTTAAVAVVMSVFSGPSSALSGTTTVNTNSSTGRATFSTLSLPTAGTYVLRATVTGITALNSNSFEISAPAPTGIPRLVLAPGANKRYFVSATTGLPVYMVGSHTWTNLQERSTVVGNFDYPLYLTKMGNNWDAPLGGLAKHRLIRLWMAEDRMNGGILHSPNPFMQDGPGGTYNFGPMGNCTLANPDTPRFNQAYFDRLATRVSQARTAGIYVSVMLFNAWSIIQKDECCGNPWPSHWYNPNKNCNGIDGGPNGAAEGLGYRDGMATTARAPMKGGTGRTVNNHNTIWRIQLAYVKKVIDTIHSAAAGGGDNVLYEISNEDQELSSDWQDDLINEIKAYEAQGAAGACGGQTCKAHLVGKTWLTCGEGPGTCSGPTGADDELTSSPADWISLWQYAVYPDEDDDPRVPPSDKVNLSDTDHGYVIDGIPAWTPHIIWKHFFRGHNLWFMEEADLLTNTSLDASRRAMGYTTAYADKVNMTAMTIQGKGTSSPASSGYSLTNATAGHYMALRLGSPLTFSVPAGSYTCEWFNIDTGAAQSCGTVSGTPSSQPFTNAVVLMKSTTAAVQTITSVAFLAPPNDEQVNTAMTPAVVAEVRDQDGLPYTEASVLVQMRVFSGPEGAVVSNNTVSSNTVTGHATFNALSLNVAGTYRFRVVVMEAGEDVTDAISDSFVISAATPVATSLTFAPPSGQQPTAAVAGAVITPAVKVAVLDQFGGLFTASSVTVTLALAANPGGATLSGTLAKTTSGGVATFDNLSLNVAATGYSVQATAPGGLTSPTSATFTITAPAIAQGTVGARQTRGLLIGR